MRLLLLLLLAGCTIPSADPTADRDTEPLHITNYAALPLRPLNCGTPYDFRICPLPVRPEIKVEPLFIPSVIIQEMDGTPVNHAEAAAPDDDE